MTDRDDTQLVQAETQAGVRRLWLNRPDARNALNTAMRQALQAALLDAEADPEVRCILVMGRGANFCAGADIQELAARTMLSSSWAPDRLDSLIEGLSKPVVGALHGYALGGGMEMALAFTLRIAREDFQGGFPEVKLGVFPALGGTQRLPRLVGEARAMELMLTGRRFDAQEALAMGLVARVVPASSFDDDAMSLARGIAEGPPVAIRAIVEGVRRAGDLSRRDGLDYERKLFGIVCGTADKQEGTRAWIEKRKPTFTGQ